MSNTIFALAWSFLAASAAVAMAHRLSDGAVLSHRTVALAVFSIAWLVAFAAIRTRAPSRTESASWADRSWVAIAFAGALAVLLAFWGRGTGLPGDYSMHRMYVLQLLNGHAAPHEPYAYIAGHYTFLPHAIVALVGQATGLTVHYAMMWTGMGVSAACAGFAFALARALSLGRVAAWFFCGLVVCYGGFLAEIRGRQFYLFLTAPQLSMPFLGRNLALLLVLMSLWVAATWRDRREPWWLSIGLPIGLLGLTHPWEFGVGMASIGIAAARAEAVLRRTLLAAIGVAAVIASAYFGPVALAWWRYGIHATAEVARAGQLPVDPALYGPLVPFLLAAAVGRPFWRSPIAGLWAGLAVLLALDRVAAWAAGAGVEIGIEGGLLKFERFAVFAILAVFATSAFGLDVLRRRFGSRPAALLAVVWVAVGWISLQREQWVWLGQWASRPLHTQEGWLGWLDRGEAWPPTRLLRAPVHWSELDGAPLFFRGRIDDRRGVVLVPCDLGFLVASRNGVDVACSERFVRVFRSAPHGPIPQRERRTRVADFYRALEQGRLDRDELAGFGARHFLAPARTAFEARNGRAGWRSEVRDLGDVGPSDRGGRWLLYALPPP